MVELRKMFPNAGVKEMVSHLFYRKQKKVPRCVIIQDYFRTFEPELIQARMGRNLKRKQFWAAGVNVLWCMDQHDKWKYKFGLCFHVGVDPFSGYLLWLRVWWNNSNPLVVCRYYLDTVKSLGYVPLLTQSDPGTENTRVANAQSYMRQLLDPLLDGIQHVWKRNKMNIKAEIEWSLFRRKWSPGFENLFDEGIMEGNLIRYDKSNPLQALVFRFLSIPWLQGELDHYRHRVNNTRKRKNAHKLTPHGRAEDIHFRPNDFDARDFKIPVPPQCIQQAEDAFIEPGHRVLRLVPESFQQVADAIFEAMGSPEVSMGTFWDLYLEMLEQVEVGIETGAIPLEVVQAWSDEFTGTAQEDDEAAVEAVEEADLPDAFNPEGPAPEGFIERSGAAGEGPPMAEFTDDEGDAEEGEEWVVR
ncbi:hypothetical protein DFP72DRAFT_999679 [Ephemerocybe angulata]|uniref:Integrase core domain-containing protein n=1 Tax=Ephemerocybe angulata TaxID=980116 RepID=A0A8H6IDJ5_9AGAR|nr:hypothetical protein DFP72DRAFT_999679 [Tulosesus angulatus]